jgi:hypothetical protein
MILGRSIVFWIVVAFIAICVFFVAQWLIPLLFGLVDVIIPAKIVNILAILVAAGVFYGGWNRGVVTA